LPDDEADIDPDDADLNSAAFVAEMDQHAAALANLAKLVAAYYVALRMEGVEGDHATELAVEYQAVMLAQMLDD
jgi:hypothetical protein